MLTKWDPFKNFEKFFEPEYLFVAPAQKLYWDLPVDLYEEAGKIVAEMNLPGVDPKLIDINFKNGDLRICATREEKEEKKEKEFYFKEIKTGFFERTINLPFKVNTEKVEAQYKNGVLKVLMPIKEMLPTEKVKVQIQ
jgi:HSP20 family protein